MGQKIRVLLYPVRGSRHMQPVRVTLIGESAGDSVVALSDLGKYVSADVSDVEAQPERIAAGAKVATGWPPMPEAEKSLIAAVEKARTAYAAGANEMAQGAARPARAKEICAAVKDLRVSNWLGEVETLSSNSDGLGVLSIQIAEGISIKTWNIALADVEDRTLIDPDSAVFKQAVVLRKGQRVTFGGQFFRSPTDCIREGSLTLNGSLTEPEFIFRFSDVQAVRIR